MNDNKRPLIIGITGGTGSGKSTVCKAIIDNIPEENIATLEQDAYYKDQSHLTFEERLKTNYDHPLSFDNKLLIKHIEELCEGKTIEKPIYDYELHTRKQNETVTISPSFTSKLFPIFLPFSLISFFFKSSMPSPSI